jgi:ribonuclease R
MPPEGEPVFYRSVIRSDARLTYGEAQRREAPPEILDALALNDELASLLRERRFARGALQVESPEAVFRFDGEGGVAEAWLEGEPHAHMLVEELMILANEHVGAFLSSRNREALYRVHERPDPQAVELLVAKLAELGVPTPPVPERLAPQQAAVLAGDVSKLVATYVSQAGRGREAFPALVLRALKRARYDAKNLGHAGLASPAYCHFTSPIRRYPDLVVHRALLRELGIGDDPLPGDLHHLAEHTSEREREAARIEYLADEICLAWLLERQLYERGWDDPLPGDLHHLAEHTSEREREAARIEYLADEICLAWLLERQLYERGWDDPWEGEIIGLIGSGLFVRFGEVFEGFLPARRLHGEFYELNPLATALAGRTTGRAYRLGDAIEVLVHSISRNEGKVDLSLGRG